jgi:hypothetical protein
MDKRVRFEIVKKDLAEAQMRFNEVVEILTHEKERVPTDKHYPPVMRIESKEIK